MSRITAYYQCPEQYEAATLVTTGQAHTAKRFIIETVKDHLKNNEQIEHSRHRSLTNCSVNLLAGLIAYQLQPKKPSIRVPKVLTLEA